MRAADHHLGVVDDVEAEDEGPQAAVDHLEVVGRGDEDHDDAEDDEDKEEAAEGAAACRKVNLGLEESDSDVFCF